MDPCVDELGLHGGLRSTAEEQMALGLAVVGTVQGCRVDDLDLRGEESMSISM